MKEAVGATQVLLHLLLLALGGLAAFLLPGADVVILFFSQALALPGVLVRCFWILGLQF